MVTPEQFNPKGKELNIKLTVTGENPPPAEATPEGLPDTSTQLATRHNAKLLWQAARGRAAGSGTPNTREGRAGVLAQLNVSALMNIMWDGYDPSPWHSGSNAARMALYKYLRDAADMVCVQRRSAADGSMWWIASEWQDKPPAIRGSYTERKLTPREAGEDRPLAPADITYICKFPGCDDDRTMSPHSLGRHLGKHSVTFGDYKQMVTGETPWPDKDTSAEAPAARKSPKLTIAGDATGQAAWTDPLGAVEALVAEVRKNRALVSDSDLVEENKFLRAELEDTRAQNAKLRQRLAAADKVLGRRS